MFISDGDPSAPCRRTCRVSRRQLLKASCPDRRWCADTAMLAKVCTFAHVGSGARVFVGEGDPFCALQACFESVQVAAIETAVSGTDSASSTCNFDISTLDHMKMTKNSAFVGNRNISLLAPNASVVLLYSKTYELPVGFNTTVGPEHSRCPGELFQPKGLRAPRRKHHHCWR